LSWVAGPQGVERPQLPAMKDVRRPERRRLTVLETPDHV
jgi:NADH-quinone oxidoreductase subunit B